MAQYSIRRKRISKVSLPKEFDLNTIQIGVPVIDDEAKKVGLEREGDIVLPSGKFGKQSEKNAYGYSYADKTKPKERRYVSTNWIQPFGNDNASPVAVDIYRPCYPQINIPAYEIELQLYVDQNGNRYVIVNLTEEIRKNFLKEAINLLLEIYGVCYIFEKDILIDKLAKRQRCNWEILPAGEMPSKHIEKQLGEQLRGLFASIDQGNPPMKINRYNGGLFKEDPELDSLVIPDEILETFIQLSSYDFNSDLNVNILGQIFEQSISDVEQIKNEISGVQIDGKGKQKEDGIFYTPYYVTRYIVEQTVGVYLTAKKEELKHSIFANGAVSVSVYRESTKRYNEYKFSKWVEIPEAKESLTEDEKMEKDAVEKLHLIQCFP